MIERLRYINPKSSFDDKLSLEHFVAVNKVNVSKDQAKMINTDQQNKSHKKERNSVEVQTHWEEVMNSNDSFSIS